ncbi:MAG: transglutaminase-like domain-containing protein [Bacillota bacterium]|nr:transglutaminase-like domain-containing protein [Bacillota bacterium]
MCNKGLKAVIFMITAAMITIASFPHTSSAASVDNSTVTRNIQISVQVTNSGRQPATGVEVQLPLISADSTYQQTSREIFNQKVEKIETGETGSRTAHVVIDSISPGQSETIIVDYLLRIKPGGGLTSTGALNELQCYLKPSSKIESSHPEIVALAEKLTGDIDDEIAKINQIGKFIDAHMNYQLNSVHKNRGALSALRHGEGVCEDYAALFVALSRASGMPARQVNGFCDSQLTGASWRTGSSEVSLQGFRHSWAEVYIQGLGWVAVDPTFKIYPKKGQASLAELSVSHIAQNYSDQPVKVSYQGEKLSVGWGNLLVNKQ